MNSRLDEELSRIPRGEHHQNVLRAVYNMQRRSDLVRHPLAPAASSLQESIRLVRKDEPTFEATFDRAYFRA